MVGAMIACSKQPLGGIHGTIRRHGASLIGLQGKALHASQWYSCNHGAMPEGFADGCSLFEKR